MLDSPDSNEGSIAISEVLNEELQAEEKNEKRNKKTKKVTVEKKKHAKKEPEENENVFSGDEGSDVENHKTPESSEK